MPRCSSKPRYTVFEEPLPRISLYLPYLPVGSTSTYPASGRTPPPTPSPLLCTCRAPIILCRATPRRTGLHLLLQITITHKQVAIGHSLTGSVISCVYLSSCQPAMHTSRSSAPCLDYYIFLVPYK
uniref:WNK3 n=1 Tax=Arundo donax TaxID=35708 RepID=A0A0A9EKX2_ARUDO